MKRLLPALLLVSLFSVHSESDMQPAAPLVTRLYDVTEIVDCKSGLPGAAYQLSAHHGPTWNSGTFSKPIYSPLYYGTESPKLGEEFDRLEELVYDAIARVPDHADTETFRVNPVESAGRFYFLVRATRSGHEEVRHLLEPIRLAVGARVHVTLSEDGRLVGTATGRIGQELSIARSAERAHTLTAERGGDNTDFLILSNFQDGDELSCWAVKLPDGRLRVQGQFYQQTLTKLRAMPTQAGTFELPEFLVNQQPFAVDVPDPGEFLLRISNGRELQLSVSCGTEMQDVVRELPNGSTLHYRNLLGLLRRPQLRGFLNRTWWYLSGPSIYYPSDEPNWMIRDRFEERLTNYPGAIRHDCWGYGQALIWEPGSRTDRDLATQRANWTGMHEWLDRQVLAKPGRFQARVWLVPESESQAKVDKLGPPLASAELTTFEGQLATWSQSAATRYVSGYGVYVATPVAVRNVFEDLARWGNEWTISWERGQANAEWVHVRPDESIERFDTGLKEYGPLVIEAPTTRRHELHWLAPLGVGEKSVAVSPAGDGHVLVGELHRLE